MTEFFVDEEPWMREFISVNPDGSFTAWDETQAWELGTFPDRQGAVRMLAAYSGYTGYERTILG